MKHELFTQIALSVDMPHHGLRRGDLATIVEYLPAGNNPEPGYALEVFNALGESISVIAVAESQVESLRSDEICHVRSLAPTGT